MFENNKSKRTRGRPKNLANSFRYCVRFSEEENNMLDRISAKNGWNRSETIRRAVMTLYYMNDFED